MAFNSTLRKSATFLRPFVPQLLKSQRDCHAALLTAANHGYVFRKEIALNQFVPKFHFSTKKPVSDESLIRVIGSEIKCAEETDDHYVEETPRGFPFKMHDNPGHQTVMLERTYQDEEIKVEVHMPDLVTGENDDDRDDDDDTERPTQSSIPLVVSVSKKGGPFLEFGCMAYADEITIDSLAVKKPESPEDEIAYEGPDFQDLDENLQKAFRKYLEIRGIKPSTTNFLHEYMINKDSREYLVWLKKLKKFVEA